jgi:hypothetical protein
MVPWRRTKVSFTCHYKLTTRKHIPRDFPSLACTLGRASVIPRSPLKAMQKQRKRARVDYTSKLWNVSILAAILSQRKSANFYVLESCHVNREWRKRNFRFQAPFPCNLFKSPHSEQAWVLCVFFCYACSSQDSGWDLVTKFSLGKMPAGFGAGNPRSRTEPFGLDV